VKYLTTFLIFNNTVSEEQDLLEYQGMKYCVEKMSPVQMILAEDPETRKGCCWPPQMMKLAENLYFNLAATLFSNNLIIHLVCWA